MKTDNLDKFGELIDSIDNLVAAMSIPMPAEFHIEQLKASLPEKSKELKAIYKDESGEDPWRYH